MNSWNTQEHPAASMDLQSRRIHLRMLAALPLAAALPGLAQEAWPSRPIRVIVPAPAGGGTDNMARALTDKMREILNATIIIENRAGATTAIGTEYVSIAAPDGLTLLFASPPGFTILPHLRPVKYTLEQFEPVGAVGNIATMVVARKDLPVETLADLIAAAKKAPGKITFGFPGVGSLGHMAGEVFVRQAGIEVLNVPYKGSADTIAAALGGQVDFIVNDAAGALIKEGRLKGLAAFIDKPLPSLPQVPSIRQAGFTAPIPSTPMGILAPKGTPKPILDKLTGAIQKAMMDPSLVERLQTYSVAAQWQPPEEFLRLLVQGRDAFGVLIREKGIKDSG
jgi:tripartite-type tricarboxylate transporter receptor subunit TctC